MSPAEIVAQYFTYLNGYNLDGLASLLAGNFTHEFRPASIGGMGAPVRNGPQLVDWLENLQKLIVVLNFNAPIETIVADNTVVVHVTSEGQTPALNKSFPNEHLFIFHFEGGKISSIKEFMDSKYVAQLAEDEKAAGFGLNRHEV
ncbi:hypothetical protein LshimejAT787_1001440 [Lyophyllum shimeji]|uniref:SnoaL-like domain-containing protein n=1 Tax=Lyophyllum shimeji TaxID=47721 RepID=A0A9P3UNF1_LYOSH|nr:hypothetical protein LshimejAT787_1001440 [Lyophyllum shimeji]